MGCTSGAEFGWLDCCLDAIRWVGVLGIVVGLWLGLLCCGFLCGGGFVVGVGWFCGEWFAVVICGFLGVVLCGLVWV